MLTFRTHSEEETIVLGQTLAGVLRQGDVVTLDGDLGAGKTRLVRGVAAGLQVDPALVSSPTYVLIHQYPPPAASPLTPPLVHVDAYRLAGPDDLDTLGWDRVHDGFSIVLIEWGQRIISALGQEPSLARIHIELGQDAPPPLTDHTIRTIRLIAPPAWASRPGWSSLAALALPTEARPSKGGALPPPSGWARCPTCGDPVPPDAPTFPFSSPRCRMSDLGKWFSGAFVVSRDIREDDLSDPDLDQPFTQN